jgi:hypothetical protein
MNVEVAHILVPDSQDVKTAGPEKFVALTVVLLSLVMARAVKLNNKHALGKAKVWNVEAMKWFMAADGSRWHGFQEITARAI